MKTLMDFAVVFLPTLISVLSVIVSIKLTRGESHRGWWATIIIIGISTSVLTWKSQANSRTEHERELVAQREQQRVLREKLDQSLLSQQYTKGQLESIALMIGKLGESRSDPSLTKLANAIAKMSRSSANGGPASEPRRLSEAKRNRVAALLRSGAGRRIVIYVPSPASERDRTERQDYAKDLQLAFEQAKWKVVPRYSNDADLSDYSGLLFVYDKGNPPESWPDFTFLKKAFESADIKYAVAGLDAMDIYTDGATTADPVIYVGEK
jgi:hypothetical protein